MGLEGFSGNESILYHLHSPCRVKEIGSFERIEREEWDPGAHQHRHFRTMGVEPDGDAVSGRKLLMWNDDVEIALCRPSAAMEHHYRNGEGRRGRLRPRGQGHSRDDLRRPALSRRRLHRHPARHDLPVPPRGRAALPRLHLARPDRDPAPLPQRVRAAPRARALLPPRHPSPHGAEDALGPRRARRQVPGQGRLPDLRPRLPPVRCRGLGRLRLSVDVQHQRLRADHGPDPHAASGAPDLPGAQLRHLLLLPAQARLRPARHPDPVPPLEPELGGDDLLRLRQLRLAQGDRDRARDATRRYSARAAAGLGGRSRSG